MVTRISTSLAFDRAIQAISDRQARMIRNQEELATGKKLLVASDDPMAVADAERTRSELRRVERQQRISDYATNALSRAESVLGQVGDLLQSIRERVIQAGNGAYAPGERAAIATQLEGYRKELFGLVNLNDSAGNFVFGGQGTASAPFVDDGTKVNYVPKPGEQQVGLDSTVSTTVDGNAAFPTDNLSDGVAVFKLIDDTIALLSDSTKTSSEIASGVQSGLAGLDRAFDRVLTKRTQIGEQLRQLESSGQLDEANRVDLQTKLSEIQDVDFAKAISDFTQNQTVQQAAMKTYSEIARMTLFDYL